MRRAIFLLIIAILLCTYGVCYGESLNITGEAAILIDYDTKAILYEKNMNEQLYPASTTKMITAILAIERGNLDDIITIDQEVVSLTKGSHIALEPGEKLTLRELLYALLVQSANDSAFAIGKYVSGSINGFVNLMNEKAKEIGAINTNFVNPNGLHVDDHVSTAYDLAMIAQYAMQNDIFREYVNTVSHTIEPTNIKTEARYLKSTNKLLYSNELINLDGKNVPIKYKNASGVKTGYTSQAQNCLVSYVEENNQRLIAVVLKSSGNDVYSDTHRLLDYGFNNFRNTPIGYVNEFVDNVKISKGLQPVVAGILDKSFVYPLLNGNIENVERKIVYNDDLVAPIKKGDVLGKVEYFIDGQSIGESNIISTMDVALDPMTKTLNKILDKWYLFVFAIIIISRILVLKSKKRKRRHRRRSYAPYV